MKWENKNKKKGKRVLPVFGERNLEKRMIKNDKNLRWSQVQIEERERERERENFWKSHDPFLKNLIHDIRLIEKQFGSIENLEKHIFRKNNLIFENTPQSIEYKK